MATYDEMNTVERQKFMEILASLTGLQQGPHGVLPNGSHYDYDPVLKTTVEVAPSGERFPVTLVGGKLQRKSSSAVA